MYIPYSLIKFDKNFYLGICVVDETPEADLKQDEGQSLGLVKGVRTAYSVPQATGSGDQATVGDTDASLEDLMAQMKSM